MERGVRMNPYIGHATQYYGVEEHRLVGGKGDGMRLLEITNGRGLEMTLSLDRGAGISRLRYKGVSVNYMSPCGYVAPAYYDPRDTQWLKGFTAGFLTTCGLNNVGSPCTDRGDVLPLHGDIDYTPAQQVHWEEREGKLHIHALVPSEVIFGAKLTLQRHIAVSLTDNTFTLEDTLRNEGDTLTPVEILYHMNLGYPLLDEDAMLKIPSVQVTPRDEEAARHLKSWQQVEKPQPGYKERCYFHTFEGQGRAALYQPKLSMGLLIQFDPRNLNCFTQWKMMGVRDYVMGLEPGNCLPTGREAMRKDGQLKFLAPEEETTYRFSVTLFDDRNTLQSIC